MNFGFTNSDEVYREVCAFRDAAIADGWSHTATYESEPEERASRLIKEGFVMQILSRSRDNEVLCPERGYRYSVHGKWKYEAQVNVWGPDGLGISLTDLKYDWQKIKDGLRRCDSCGAQDVDTQRYSFAGRCCAKCRPEMARQYEKPGWDN